MSRILFLFEKNPLEIKSLNFYCQIYTNAVIQKCNNAIIRYKYTNPKNIEVHPVEEKKHRHYRREITLGEG
jgi:hypothetical protein